MATQVTKHYSKPWQLLVSVCLTRFNVLRSQISGIEERYAQLLDQMEREQAVLNDYEYKKKLLQAAAQRTVTTATTTAKSSASKMKISEEEEKQVMDASRQLAAIQDKEEMWAADLAQVKVASISNKKKDGDQSSLQRCLDEVLHMVVEDKTLLNEKTMVYPYDTIKPGESLRQASERIIANHGIVDEDILYLSNAPVGVVKIRFNENEERGKLYQGTKIFFTKAQLTSTEKYDTQSKNNEKLSTYIKWLMLKEMEQKSNTDYFKRVRKFVN